MFCAHSLTSGIPLKDAREEITFLVCGIFTNTGSVITLNFITKVAGTEVAANGVTTILVASTDVTCTLVNVYNCNKYMYSQVMLI